MPKTTCLSVIFHKSFSLIFLRVLQVWASRNATPLWYASFDHTLRAFKKENVGATELQELFNRTEVRSFIILNPFLQFLEQRCNVAILYTKI